MWPVLYYSVLVFKKMVNSIQQDHYSRRMFNC